MILIVDFGSQYTQLIARRVRESHVYCEIVSCHHVPDWTTRPEIRGVILSGGPASVYRRDAPTIPAGLLESRAEGEQYKGPPVLGICYGMQLMTHLLGGKVARSARREYGRAELEVDRGSKLFHGVGTGEGPTGRTIVWMSHGDRIERAPPGFVAIARTENAPIAAMAHRERPLYALQFHPEVVHTAEGRKILQNFLFSICGLEPSWTMASFRARAIEAIRAQTGKDRVLCALSGGVDSAVAATLVHEAIGPRLVCVFVDNGLLRLNERKRVEESLGKHLKLHIKYIDATDEFLRNLKGVPDPEKKRRVVGRTFIRVFERVATRLGKFRWLVQGTLYPDLIESVSYRGPSATIKTHHNVGGLPKQMKFQLIEPLKELFKDEVRLLGAELGIPEEILVRHPFPGPGLAVRILGSVTRERLEVLRQAEAIVEEEVRRAGLERSLWQAFAVLLPIRTVGVMGDERTYSNVIALRAVTSVDGMTADWARLPADLLAAISNRITNEVHGVNRVVYDISSKPPSTIEWE